MISVRSLKVILFLSAVSIAITGEFANGIVSNKAYQRAIFVNSGGQQNARIGFSSFLGGGSTDEITSLTVDKEGNLYLVGFTQSQTFPVKNAFQSKKGGGLFDGFLIKLNPNNQVVFSTFFGGTGLDQILAVSTDQASNIYIAGFTDSRNFPTTLGSFQRGFNGNFGNAFLSKFDKTGRNLIYSTYLGGTGAESVKDIAVEASGNVIVTGSTDSPNFPVKNSSSLYAGNLDAFLTKVNSSGSGLVYSTYLGGFDEDIATNLSLDSFGNAYITGTTRSSNFPQKRTLFPFHPGFKDIFVTKTNRMGSIVYSVLFGGTQLDVANAIAVSKAGNVYIGGLTKSDDLPVKNALQSSFGAGETKAFLAKINSMGTNLIFSTYLGGTGLNSINSVVVDSSGNAYVCGNTNASDIPLVDPVQNQNKGTDMFLAKVDSSGQTLLFSSYLGGNKAENAKVVSRDSSSFLYVAGYTQSSGSFPLLNAFQNQYGGGLQDGFITRIENIP
jgi:hypothetical protein